MKNSVITLIVIAAALAITVTVPLRRALADTPCAIPNSACYPWRIPAGDREVTLLTIVPNNAVTGAIYRICLCPPKKSVALVFRFGTDDVVIGGVEVGDAGPVCHDFRFETSRRSKLVLRRAHQTDAPVVGCYVTAPTGP